MPAMFGDSLPDLNREISGNHLEAFTLEDKCARITVAGQWRIFTALPEHSTAVQVKLYNGDNRNRRRF